MAVFPDLHQGSEDVWLEQDRNLEFLEGTMFERDLNLVLVDGRTWVRVISNFNLVSILKAV